MRVNFSWRPRFHCRRHHRGEWILTDPITISCPRCGREWTPTVDDLRDPRRPLTLRQRATRLRWRIEDLTFDETRWTNHLLLFTLDGVLFYAVYLMLTGIGFAAGQAITLLLAMYWVSSTARR